MTKHLVLTTGDPNSIGPEVCAKALRSWLEAGGLSGVKLDLFGNLDVIQFYDSNLISELNNHIEFKLNDLQPSYRMELGKPTRESGNRSLEDLAAAAELCLSANNTALVTGPVDKFVCAQTEPDFTGQTGFLKRAAQVKNVSMLLSGPNISVGLVTTHIPVSEVSASLSIDSVVLCARQMQDYFMRTKGQCRLAVCALNPHAGDRGLLGREEIEVIQPAISILNDEYNIEAFGPFPADTIFYKAREDFDAFVCMYHDQALIPLKLLDFEDAVNISLGLPFLRTSVDHGTAYDIAGKSEASFKSYSRAIQLAVDFLS